jgi:hypothetical protein
MLTLIQTAKLDNIDPQAWLADVLARINDHNIHIRCPGIGRPSLPDWQHESCQAERGGQRFDRDLRAA